jgi:hypothetical protein
MMPSMTPQQPSNPLPVDNLTPDSSDLQIQDHITKSIQQCMAEGKGSQKDCAGMCYGIARSKTKKPLNIG